MDHNMTYDSLGSLAKLEPREQDFPMYSLFLPSLSWHHSLHFFFCWDEVYRGEFCFRNWNFHQCLLKTGGRIIANFKYVESCMSAIDFMTDIQYPDPVQLQITNTDFNRYQYVADNMLCDDRLDVP